MAEWWQLTIPGALTLLGTWSGSWLQSHSTERQARKANKGRRLGERRTAYTDLGKTSHVLMLAASLYWRSEAALQRMAAEDDLSKLEANRDKAMADFNAAGNATRDAMVSVQVIGSEQQAKIAKELDAEWEKLVREPPRSYNEFASVRDRFLAQARVEARAELSET